MFRHLKRAVSIATVAGAATLMYAYANANEIVPTYYFIDSSRISRDYSILYVSDIHYGHVQRKESAMRAIEELHNLDMDLLIIGGDVVMEGVSREDMRDVFEALGKVPVNIGRYYVYGNHDRPNNNGGYMYTGSELKSVIEANNITILEDSGKVVNDELLILGRKEMDFPYGHFEDIQDISDVPVSDYYTIVADHIPCDQEINAMIGADLQLSGHTHRGQIFPGSLAVSAVIGQAYGMKDYGRMKSIVSSGFGVGRVPFRTEGHCEYVVISLKSTK